MNSDNVSNRFDKALTIEPAVSFFNNHSNLVENIYKEFCSFSKEEEQCYILSYTLTSSQSFCNFNLDDCYALSNIILAKLLLLSNLAIRCRVTDFTENEIFLELCLWKQKRNV